jgi:hypothetical protein
MKTDKEFALDLLGWVEQHRLEISILRHLLNYSNVKDWEQRAAKMKQDAGALEILHKEHQVWRDAVLSSPDITEAANSILAKLDQPGPGT